VVPIIHGIYLYLHIHGAKVIRIGTRIVIGHIRQATTGAIEVIGGHFLPETLAQLFSMPEKSSDHKKLLPEA